VEVEDTAPIFAEADRSRAELEPWLPWVPFNRTVDEAHTFTEASVADWDGARALRLVVRTRESRAVVGIMGLESVAHLHRKGELGYWLTTHATGKGYATEAALAVVHWAFGQLGMHRVQVAVATSNHRSLGVVRRAGFRFEGIARQAEWCDGRWLDHALFSRLSTDDTSP
jgi:ribosomal-protein-serine acetyltransferase